MSSASYVARIRTADTFGHLVGVPRPSPLKTEEFRAVDLASRREAVWAATEAGIRHFVYVSVAQPAPVMKGYAQVRAEVGRVKRDASPYSRHTPGMVCWQYWHLPLWMCTVLTVYPVRSTTILRHLGQ